MLRGAGAFLLVVIAVIIAGETDVISIGNFRGDTVLNVPRQVSGDRVKMTGNFTVEIHCSGNDTVCDTLARQEYSAGHDNEMTVTVTAAPASKCFMPIYKSGTQTYEATVEARAGKAHKTLAITGEVHAKAIGLRSCGQLHQYLATLAGDDLQRQISRGLTSVDLPTK